MNAFYKCTSIVLLDLLLLTSTISGLECSLLPQRERVVLARGWSQHEIDQELAALLANHKKPETIAGKIEHLKQIFYGAGKTEFSRCFRKYIKEYMKIFFSNKGIMGGDSPTSVYTTILPAFGERLLSIKNTKLRFTEEMRRFYNIEGSVEEYIVLELEKLLLEVSPESSDYDRLTKELCFWLAIYTAPLSFYDDYFDASGPYLKLINCLKYLYGKNKLQKSKEDSCCNIL